MRWRVSPACVLRRGAGGVGGGGVALGSSGAGPGDFRFALGGFGRQFGAERASRFDALAPLSGFWEKTAGSGANVKVVLNRSEGGLFCRVESSMIVGVGKGHCRRGFLFHRR